MIQERVFSIYPAISLPIVTQDEDRGFFKCCERLLVLANGSSNTWENDVNSAWIKLSDPTDTVTFTLLNSSGLATTYTPTTNEFINEENAFYTTIPWADVLASDGEDCYRIKVEYNIGGLSGDFIWAVYDLRTFSIQNALGTARIRTLFNLNQKIEGINFTGSNVEDSIRFNGQIEIGQPNMEIDSLIYENRRVETVVNENLQSYDLLTDPYTDAIIKQLTNLYLLSANEMFISDHNAHSSSYQIFDLPVTIQESPEVSKPDKFSRFRILSATLSDREKNKRTFY